MLLTVVNHHVFPTNIREDGVTCHQLVSWVDGRSIAYGEGPIAERSFERLPDAEMYVRNEALVWH
jgi:hypothetical protein